MTTTVPSTPVSYGGAAMPLRILNKGPEYFRNSKLRASGSENRRKTAAERLEADKFKYVKSEEVRQRRFTLELRTSSPPNNDSTGAQSMGTASTGSPINMDDDDITAGNDVTGDFSAEGIMQTMSNFTRYKEVKSQNATPVQQNATPSKRQQRRPSSEQLLKFKEQMDKSAENLHSMTATRRQQRMKNKALRSAENNNSVNKNTEIIKDNVTPPSPLITRLRETLHGSNSSHSMSGNAFTPSPTVGVTAEEGPKSVKTDMKTSETDIINKEVDSKHSHISKSSSTGHSINNYISRAKEGIKSVASFRAIIGLDKDNISSERYKQRQSRSTAVNNGRRYRSASAGPNVHKSLQHNPRTSADADDFASNCLAVTTSEAGSPTNPIMSPRSQLKHVRQNLKKVKTGPERTYNRKHTNSENVPSKYTAGLRKVGASTTFVVDPKATQKIRILKNNEPNHGTTESLEKNEPRVQTKPPLMPRSNRDKLTESLSQPTENLKKRTNSSEGMDVEENLSNTRVNQVKRANSNRVKRRSWDVLHSTADNNMPPQTSKPSVEDDVPAPTSTAMNTDSNNSKTTSRQRRPLSYNSEQRKSNVSSRMSLPEDTMQSIKDTNSHLFNKTGSRKSVAEAIEEIINPVLEDEIKNRNSAASPDVGSMDRNTLVANRESFFGNLSTAATFGTGSITSKNARRNSSVADNINSVLGGAIDEKISDSDYSDQFRTKQSSKYTAEKSSPPYTRSRAMAAQKLKEKESSSTELLDSSGHFTKSSNKPPSFFDGPSSSSHLRPVPMRQHSAPTGLAHSRPTSRVDVQPQFNVGTDDGQLTHSPVSAPKSRREVEPDRIRRRSQTTKFEDTIKSHHTTSSSASGDGNKPFTALTASDLKPRTTRNFRTVVPQSAPIKPTFAFPGQPVPQARHTPKRHTTTPVSPTLSPNKQAARMTPPQTPTRSCSSTPYSSLKRTPTSSRSSSLKRNRHRSKSDILPHQHELDRFFSTMGMEDSKAMIRQSSVNDTSYSNHLSSESDFSFAGASAYVRDSPDEAMDVDPTSRPLLRGPQSVSIIEKNARVMRWLMTCQKNRKQSTGTKPTPREGELKAKQSPPVSPTSAREPMKSSHQLLSTYPPTTSAPVVQNGHHFGASHPPPIIRQNSQLNAYSPTAKAYSSSPPPIPPRTYQRQHAMYPATHSEAAIAGAPKESNV